MTSIVQIQARVALAFDVPMIEMTSQRTGRAVSWPRQTAIYLARYLTGHSLAAIGRMFGGRDHTTVAWAIRRTEQRAQDNPEFREQLRDIRESLEGPIDVY